MLFQPDEKPGEQLPLPQRVCLWRSPTLKVVISYDIITQKLGP